MEHNSKIKKAFWMTEDMDREIDAHLKQDNCSSRSEFVMNALKFYVGYLNTKNASAFLPEVLSATLTGTLDGFAGRISSLLFKQGVDINLMAQIIAYSQVYLHFSQRRRIKMETLLILSCVLIILAIPFGIKESIAVKKVRIEKTAKLLGYDPVFDK